MRFVSFNSSCDSIKSAVGMNGSIRFTRKRQWQASDHQSRMNEIMKVQRKDLVRRAEDEQGEKLLRIDVAKARDLVQATTWLPFGELGLVGPFWSPHLGRSSYLQEQSVSY
jgi:hypothetical protein